MSQENPFNDAMDSAEDDTGGGLGEFDVDEFIEALDDGQKEQTIGVAVTEEMHAVYKELQQAEEVDVDVAESIRSHITNLAHRHEQATERAGRKLQIDREL